MNNLTARWQDELAALPAHAKRSRAIVQKIENTKRKIGEQVLADFSSNDYLGLSQEPYLQSAWQNAANSFGVGSGASMVVSGYSQPQAELEQALAQWLGFDRAIIYPSGYLTNVDVLCTLLKKTDRVWLDQLSHASLFDGVRYSGAKFSRFEHGHVTQLEQQCARAAAKYSGRLIISDGVFSMEGSIAPIQALAKIANDYHASLLIDDAHGMGILGEHGEGVIENLSDRSQVLLTGTLSKAFGGLGGFVVGNKISIEYLLQHSRGLRYATALPAGLLQASLKALDLIKKQTWRREKLFENIALWQQIAQASGLQLLASTTPIQSVMIGCPNKVLQLGEQLIQSGFLVGVMRAPTVPKGKERLRISLSAEHDSIQIIALAKTIARLMKTF